MNRPYIIDSLKELLTDEYNANELIYLSKKELMLKIIEVANYYKCEYNN